MFEEMKNATILIIEDEDEVRSIICEIFNTLVKNTLSASNGEEALAILESGNQVDCVISDINMPKMNGIEFIKKVRELKFMLPIVFLTAYDSEDFMQSALKYGAFDFINKPFDTVNLIDVVSQAVQFEKKRNSSISKTDNLSLDNEFTKRYLEMLKGK